MTNGNVDHGLEGQLRHACAELDRRLRAGQSCLAEIFFEQVPALASHSESAVELIYTEFATREELGQQPAPQEYFRRFPQWFSHLQEQFQIHALIRTADRTHPATELPGEKVSDARAGSDEGRTIGSYESLEETARGAMGVVYKARHRLLNRTVALKMMLAGSHAGQAELLRFGIEADVVARLQHPNIVQIYEVGRIGGQPYLALEYVAGGSLAQKLVGMPQSPSYAAELIATLAQAIHYAHQQGVLHRDLKPANVLLALDGTPKITDFGLAKLLDGSGGQTESGAVCGTPSYMAPEQAAGRSAEIGPAVDIHALGAILYELLTGRPPFQAESLLQTLSQVVARDPPSPDRLQSGVPRDLATICMKCLQKEPRRRYGNAGLLAEDLRCYLAGNPVLARPVAKWEHVWKWARRRPAFAALVLTLGLAAITAMLGTSWYTGQLQVAAANARFERNQARAAAEDAEDQRLYAQAAVRDASRQQSQAQAAVAEARQQKSEAGRQSEQVKKQFDYTRRLLFTIQLAQVEELWKSDPVRGMRILMDEARCPRDLRDFAWGMYHHLCTQDRQIPIGHAGGVTIVALSSDRTTLATAGAHDTTVKLWDRSDARVRLSFDVRGGRVNSMVFSPDGRLLATAGEDHAIRLWLTGTGKKYLTLRGHANPVTCVAFAPDGKSLASGSADRTARQWDVATGKELMALKGHAGPVRSLAFTPDGQMLATGSDDKTLRFWDLLTLAEDRERNSLKLDEQGAITCIAFSPDGKKLAIAGARRSAVDLFDMDTLSLKVSFRGHLDQVHTIGFSPDGKLLASGSEDRTVRLWEVDSGAQFPPLLGHAGPVRSVAFSADNQTLASAGDDANVWLWAIGVRAETQRNSQDLVHNWSGRIIAMAYSPDGQTLATGDHDGVLKLCGAQSQKLLANLPGHTGPIWSLVYSHDSKTLATCSEDGKVKLWDVQGRRKLVTLLRSGERIRAVAFSPDGKTLATGGDGGQIKLWDMATRQQRAALSNHSQAIFALGFGPDCKTLAAGGQDGKVRLWDIRTLTEYSVLTKHQKAVLFTIFSPDGNTLATGGMDHTVQLWDAHTSTLRATLSCNAGYAFSAAFTSDGKTLATGGGSRTGSLLPGEVKIWDVTTGDCHATLPGQTGPIAFSPDGRDLATVSKYVGLKTWHAALD